MTRFYSSTAQPTTLSAACTDVATTIQVAATTGFPATEFILALDYGTAQQELVKVTGVAGTTLTVVRGFDSTTAQAHSLGAAVRHVHTADDFRLSRTHEAATSGVHGVTGALVGTSDTQALTNKDLTGTGNTFPPTLTTPSSTQTFTNKTINLANNTVTGTVAQFNTAVSDGNFATLDGVETLQQKTIDLSANTISGPSSLLNASLSGDDFATLTGGETLTNKALTAPNITDPSITVGALTAIPLLRSSSTTHPGHNEGQVIYETDTDRMLVSTGAAWTLARPLGGTGSVTLSGVQSASATISFGFTFPVAPIVTATSGFADVPVAVSNVTTTGFTATAYRIPGAASITVSLNWMAVPA